MDSLITAAARALAAGDPQIILDPLYADAELRTAIFARVPREHLKAHSSRELNA
jgi:O-methyltransferase involved in polyketide biosynthesis